MSTDVYSPCVCGSGNKLKFCCFPIIDDLIKAQRLTESNQLRTALQILTKAQERHPELPGPPLAQAEICIQENEYGEAAEVLEAVLEQHPKHPYATVLYAAAALWETPFHECRAAVYRAFQRSARQFPNQTAELALRVAAQMHLTGSHMAVREHLALALRLAGDELKSAIFDRLIEVDGNRSVPYPLRSVHVLAAYRNDDAEIAADLKKAALLSHMGCWAPAAAAFRKLAEQVGDAPQLWHNAGLCNAWDGRNEKAADDLHRASALYGDRGKALECETIAQILDVMTTGERIDILETHYPVESTSRLLSRLNQDGHFARSEIDPEEVEDPGSLPAGIYGVLDRPAPAEVDALTIERLPHVVANLQVLDEHPSFEMRPGVMLRGAEGEHFDTARELLRAAAGDAANIPASDDDEPQVVMFASREWQRIDTPLHIPEEVPVVERNSLEFAEWLRFAYEVWPETPLPALGGKTPREAASHASQKLALWAAVFVLDVNADRKRRYVDLAEVFERLGVQAPPSVRVEPDASLQAVSALELRRIDLDSLTDEQMIQVARRVLVTGHGDLKYHVLTALDARGDSLDAVDPDTLYMGLATLCRERNQDDDVVKWIVKGRIVAEAGEDSFADVLQWRMRELLARLANNDEEELDSLVNHFREYYVPKLPELQASLEKIMAAYDRELPWESDAEAEPEMAGATAPGGIWTPDEPTTGGGGKLWLPGQD